MKFSLMNFDRFSQKVSAIKYLKYLSKENSVSS